MIKKIGTDREKGSQSPCHVEDAFLILENAKSVVIIGYGLAVAQAQHAVRRLGEFGKGLGCDVKWQFIPWQAACPGFMNVLLLRKQTLSMIS